MLITVDIEDHAEPGQLVRFDRALGPLLDELSSRRLRATFFVVGELAQVWRDELRELISRGHEVGLHGHSHRFLRDLGPSGARDDLERGRDRLSEVIGFAPVGYRAPYFGLTRETPWAPELIMEAGFNYSSSVLPAWNPQAGLAGAPRTPFCWRNGLVEFPAPVFGAGPLAVPLLGGMYLRVAPMPLVRLAARRAGRHLGQWTYAHPYDFDADEPFRRYGQQPWYVAKLLFARRKRMLSRILFLADPAARTLEELTADRGFVAGLQPFSF